MNSEKRDFLAITHICDTRKPWVRERWASAKAQRQPLTRQEFATKYWHGCKEMTYQYWTPDIEDGRDEMEQLILNDIWALAHRCSGLFEMIQQRGRENDATEKAVNALEKETERKQKKAAAIQAITAATAGAALILAISARRQKGRKQ